MRIVQWNRSQPNNCFAVPTICTKALFPNADGFFKNFLNNSSPTESCTKKLKNVFLFGLVAVKTKLIFLLQFVLEAQHEGLSYLWNNFLTKNSQEPPSKPKLNILGHLGKPPPKETRMKASKMREPKSMTHSRLAQLVRLVRRLIKNNFSKHLYLGN